MRRISAAIAVLAVLAGCGCSGPPGSPADRIGTDAGPQSALDLHIHANGLRLAASDAYQVRMTPAGFAIEPAPPGNTDLRIPIHVSVQLLTTQPKSTGYRVNDLGSGRTVWYSITNEGGGGSAGADYTLLAFEHSGDRWIQYRQEKQGEGEPVFELWAIARGLSYAPSR